MSTVVDKSILCIQEIKHADQPFGQEAADDTTGLGLWSASVVLARWLVDIRDRLKDQTLLELGAGCGLPGVAAMVYAEPKHLYLTDLNPDTVENLRWVIIWPVYDGFDVVFIESLLVGSMILGGM